MQEIDLKGIEAPLLEEYSDVPSSYITRLVEIGIALSSETKLNRLLEMIVEEARNFSNADAGSLYIVNKEKKQLEFAIVQNESMGIRMGGTAQPIPWEAVPMEKDGKMNFSNVSSYVANTGKIINIMDVYKAEGFDFTGTKRYDQVSGYRSKSMLLIPMKNKEEEIIGVLQLINALDPVSKEPIPFAQQYISLIASLASQAAVTITNVQLYQELEDLFENFIETIATTLDEKSPYTGGHIKRVYELTMDIARYMNEQREGPFGDFYLGEEEMNELRVAAWLHDIGKITTPEHVIDKSTKLERICDTSNLIADRYEMFKKIETIKALEEKLALYENGKANATVLSEIDEHVQQRHKDIEEEKQFILQCNNPDEFMDDEKVEHLERIARKCWDHDGNPEPCLSDNELHNLTIRKGTLTPEERKIIENHALMTHKMLSKLRFPRKYSHVPEYASSHHERLDGTGYPFGKKAPELPYPARIIAIADIFEALTATDRPYKKMIPVSKALQILRLMAQDGFIDRDIFDLFDRQRVYDNYVRTSLQQEQADA